MQDSREVLQRNPNNLWVMRVSPESGILIMRSITGLRVGQIVRKYPARQVQHRR